MPLRPSAIEIFTRAEGDHGEMIKVYGQKVREVLNKRSAGNLLRAMLFAAAAAAATALVASFLVAGHVEARRAELDAKVAQRRATLRASNADHERSPSAALERRKHETPATVIVIEELSRILPRHTYLMQLRIEGDKLQVVGFTSDAPSLIPLLERSSHFMRAIFFAPTTRAPSDPGERFSVEARIRPVGERGPAP